MSLWQRLFFVVYLRIREGTSNSEADHCQWNGEENAVTRCKIEFRLKREYRHTQTNERSDSNSNKDRFNFKVGRDHAHLEEETLPTEDVHSVNSPYTPSIMSVKERQQCVAFDREKQFDFLPTDWVKSDWTDIDGRHFYSKLRPNKSPKTRRTMTSRAIGHWRIWCTSEQRA